MIIPRGKIRTGIGTGIISIITITINIQEVWLNQTKEMEVLDGINTQDRCNLDRSEGNTYLWG
jgi:hypothetical protein